MSLIYQLKHTAEELDVKLNMIPPKAAADNKEWKRDAWTFVADQEYNSESEFAQSGLAVAAALASFEEEVDEKIDAIADSLEIISDEDIEAMFSEDLEEESEEE